MQALRVIAGTSSLAFAVTSARSSAARALSCSSFVRSGAFRRETDRQIHCLPTTKRSFATMAGSASEKKQQQDQPGKEHEMEPRPQTVPPNYKPAGKLEGKTALITGGDSGIGRAVAHLYALEGAEAIAITYVKGPEDQDAKDTAEIVKDASKGRAKFVAIPTDLGYDENCKKVIDQVVKEFGRIDILINNAAEQHTTEKLEDITPEQVERVFRTNIFSQFFLTRYALPHMKEDSSIINTTSINAYKGNKALLDYTSTKGAILAFTRGLALQLAPRKIRVNGVAPGPIWTPLIPSTMGPISEEDFGGSVPMGRAGQPGEVATAYVFLGSDDSTYYSGQVMHPNGGAVVNA